MMVVKHYCIGRRLFTRWQRRKADLLCWWFGHRMKYTTRMFTTKHGDSFAMVYCSRCYKGGYDPDRLIEVRQAGLYDGNT